MVKDPAKPNSRAHDPFIIERVDLLPPEARAVLVSEAKRRLGLTEGFFSNIEELIESPDGFGIATISPLQRAICRLVEGRPLTTALLRDREAHLADALGMTQRELEEFEALRLLMGCPVPLEVMVIAGIRTFKSLLVAASAIMATQRVDVSQCGPGEIPRYSVLSVSLDNAKAVLMHLLGVLQRPRVAQLRVSDTELKKWSDWHEIIKGSSADLVGSAFLWHPTGRPIEIRVVAGKRAGSSTVSRWGAGVGLDEAPRMVGASEGVVNYDDTRRSVLGRLLPGAQLFSMGSPWVNAGPVFDRFHESWGRPDAKDLIILKAKGNWLNPVWWTPERCAALKKRDPVAYQMDVAAEFIDAGEALFAQSIISLCTRPRNEDGTTVVPFQPGHEYAAAMDPATRGNAWTLVVVDRVRFINSEGKLDNKIRVVWYQQWIGNQLAPVSPRQTLGEVAVILKDYRLEHVYSDQWSADALKDLALGVGLVVIPETWKQQDEVNYYLGMKALMTEGLVEIPDDNQFHKDLRLVHRVVNVRGPAVRLAETADGRHCDYTPALIRAASRWIDPPKDVAPQPGTPEAQQAMLDKWREDAYRKAQGKPIGHWSELNPLTDADVIFRLGRSPRYEN
jgi:hypothetical protein